MDAPYMASAFIPESKSETAELISHTSEYNSFLLQPVSNVFSVPGN